MTTKLTLKEAREATGARLDDVAVHLRDHYGPTIGVSRETIRRIEAGQVAPSKVNPLVVAALAVEYDLTLEELELPEEVAASLATVTSIVDRLLRGRDSNPQPWDSGREVEAA